MLRALSRPNSVANRFAWSATIAVMRRSLERVIWNHEPKDLRLALLVISCMATVAHGQDVHPSLNRLVPIGHSHRQSVLTCWSVRADFLPRRISSPNWTLSIHIGAPLVFFIVPRFLGRLFWGCVRGFVWGFLIDYFNCFWQIILTIFRSEMTVLRRYNCRPVLITLLVSVIQCEFCFGVFLKIRALSSGVLNANCWIEIS